jgi:hypothetical protein
MTYREEVLIGNKGADYVSLVKEREFEGWSRATIEVHCDGWAGSVKGNFRRGELAGFAEEVRRLERKLSGIARLKPLEPNITLTLTGDGKGHITVEGVAQNDFANGTQLTFRFTIDQTYLKGIADSLSHADPVSA